MANSLPLTGKIKMHPGTTGADLTCTYETVLRGGGTVAGGSFVAQAAGDGTITPVTVQVVRAGDLVDRHPYLNVSVSFRGGGTGYEFRVDLAVAADAAEVKVDAPTGEIEMVEPGERQSLALLKQQTINAAASAEAAADRVDAGLADSAHLQEVVAAAVTGLAVTVGGAVDLVAQQRAQAAAITAQLAGTLDTVTNSNLLTQLYADMFRAGTGWSVKSSGGGTERIFEVTDGGPLELEDNGDGTFTIYTTDPSFTSTDNADGTFTIYKEI